ncbi:MAG: BTAD domain-containing putative transcriptional regulator, partial [Trueperaceae bacterium]
MPPLRTLGELAIEHDGTVVPIRADRPASLLILLACRGTPVARSEAALLYRPDDPEPDALAYLRKLVFRARGRPWATTFEADEERLAWPVATDVHAFRTACDAGDPSEALELYRGPFLDGVRMDGVPAWAAWQEMERADLQERWLRALRTQADLDLRAGRPERAAERLAALLHADPLDEGAVQARMQVLLATGRRREAVGAYRAFRERLVDEIGTEPLEATQALADAVRGGAAEAPSPQPVAGPNPDPPHDAPAPPDAVERLPRPTTPFVGRDADLDRIETVLRAGDADVVTLVGLGGAGKTRLAIEAARRVEDAFAGGSAFVRLAAVRRAETFAQHVADALAVRYEGDGLHDLARALGERPTLLVLDEFEGVLAAAPILVRLLQAAPGTRALVTSREALVVGGERIVDVAGLRLPPQHASEEAAQASDAVRLFVHRASRVSATFAPTRATLETVTDLCRRLDGMPLAIELAAAWTRSVPVEAIAEELDVHPETLLASRERDVPDRHRSLWTVFDATWRTLEPQVRAVGVRLAAFPASFPYQAAREVAGAELPQLLTLLDRSLVRRGQDGRYRMHALVRRYLAGHGDDDAGRNAHARWYADRLATLGPDLRGDDPIGALRRFDEDRADLEAAWSHATRVRDADVIEAMRDPLDYALYYRSRFADGERLFAAAADAFASDAPRTQAGANDTTDGDTTDAGRAVAQLQARLEVHRAQYERNLGRTDAARRRAERARETLLRIGVGTDLGHAAYEVATGAYQAGAYDRAEAHLREALREGRRLGDAYLQGAAENGLGNVVSVTRRDAPRAERHYRASLRAHEATGNLEGIVGARINLGACRFDQGDLDGAAEQWERALPAVRTLGSLQREAVLLANLGALDEEAGRIAEAERRYRRSLDLRTRVGDRRGEATVLHALGRLALAQGRPEEATERLRRAIVAFGDTNDPAGRAHARSSLARALLTHGRLDAAERESSAALAEAHALGAHTEILAALLTRAWLWRDRGAPQRAERLVARIAAASHGNEAQVHRQAVRLLGELRTARVQADAEHGAAVAAQVRTGVV